MNNVFNSNFLCYRTYFKHINISFGNVYFSNLPSKVLIVIAITKKKNRYFLNFCFSSVFFTYRGKNGILLFSLELFQPVNVYIFVTFFR